MNTGQEFIYRTFKKAVQYAKIFMICRVVCANIAQATVKGV
jgi:hypothetical protein